MPTEVWLEGPKGEIHTPKTGAQAILRQCRDLERHDEADYANLLAYLQWTVDRGPHPKWYKRLQGKPRLLQVSSYKSRAILCPHPSNECILIAVHLFWKQRRDDKAEVRKARLKARKLLGEFREEGIG